MIHLRIKLIHFSEFDDQIEPFKILEVKLIYFKNLRTKLNILKI